jgi:hypothetical protein
MFGGLGAWAAIDASGARPPVAEMVAAMREVNYYPSANNWGHMWTNSDPGVVDADFAQIAGLHANTVRIIVQVPAFGYPSPDPTMLDRLAQTISLADRHGLKAHLTFDLTNAQGARTACRRRQPLAKPSRNTICGASSIKPHSWAFPPRPSGS